MKLFLDNQNQNYETINRQQTQNPIMQQTQNPIIQQTIKNPAFQNPSLMQQIDQKQQIPQMQGISGSNNLNSGEFPYFKREVTDAELEAERRKQIQNQLNLMRERVEKINTRIPAEPPQPKQSVSFNDSKRDSSDESYTSRSSNSESVTSKESSSSESRDYSSREKSQIGRAHV